MDKQLRMLRPPNLTAEPNDKEKNPFSNFISEAVFVKLNNNKRFPKVSHIKVYKQLGEKLSGFHAYWNAQCMIKAILGEYPFDTALNLTNLVSTSKFWKSYGQTCKVILKCDNPYYVTEKERKLLLMKRNGIEPNMLKYLLMYDPVLSKLKNNNIGVAIYAKSFIISKGLI